MSKHAGGRASRVPCRQERRLRDAPLLLPRQWRSPATTQFSLATWLGFLLPAGQGAPIETAAVKHLAGGIVKRAQPLGLLPVPDHVAKIDPGHRRHDLLSID